MQDKSWGPKDYGYFLSLSQVGMEMVAPIGLGLALDHYLNWTPWATIAGAILGFVGGIAHLIALVNRREADSSKPRQDSH